MLVVCCGMIRSGSTLQYNLARSLVEATASGSGEGFIDDPKRDRRLRGWCWDKAWHVVKMHGIVDWMFEEQARKSIRFLFCHRNLHDVAASAKRKFGMSSQDVWKHIDDAILLQQHLQEHSEAEIQRYTDLMGDPSSCLTLVARLLELPMSDQTRSKIAASCSLENAWEIQASLLDDSGNDNTDTSPAIDEATLLHHDHISANRGQDGTWHRDLTANDLQILERRYGPWLRQEGYAQL